MKDTQPSPASAASITGAIPSSSTNALRNGKLTNASSASSSRTAAPQKSKASQKQGLAPGGKDIVIDLPTTCITKIAKRTLPKGTAIGKDAKAAFSKAAGLFILYVTQAANAICHSDKRQTIRAEDILEALDELDFVELVDPLKSKLGGGCVRII